LIVPASGISHEKATLSPIGETALSSTTSPGAPLAATEKPEEEIEICPKRTGETATHLVAASPVNAQPLGRTGTMFQRRKEDLVVAFSARGSTSEKAWSVEEGAEVSKARKR